MVPTVKSWVALPYAVLPILFFGQQRSLQTLFAALGSELHRYDQVSTKRYNRRLIDTPTSSRRKLYFKETR